MPASRNESQTAEPATVRRLAEQREDARADHGADAEEGGASDGQLIGTGSSALAVLVCARRRRA